MGMFDQGQQQMPWYQRGQSVAGVGLPHTALNPNLGVPGAMDAFGPGGIPGPGIAGSIPSAAPGRMGADSMRGPQQDPSVAAAIRQASGQKDMDYGGGAPMSGAPAAPPAIGQPQRPMPNIDAPSPAASPAPGLGAIARPRQMFPAVGGAATFGPDRR